MPGSGDTQSGKGTDGERLVRVEERQRAESSRSEERHRAVMEAMGEQKTMLLQHFEEDRAWWKKVDDNTSALKRNQERDTDRYTAVVDRVARLEDQTDQIVVAEPVPAKPANDPPQHPSKDGLRLQLSGRTIVVLVIVALGGGAGAMKAIQAMAGG